MSLFKADQVYTCLEKVYMVYTRLPPDVQCYWNLEMVGPDESISMAKNKSYVMPMATDFEVPGQCFELFVFCWQRSWIRTIDCAE